MKKLLLVMALSSAGLANAQVSRWAEVLRTDPYLSNGYFIVNPAKYQALGLHHINIDMVLATPNAAGALLSKLFRAFP
jgi:hypothetical protein